MKQVKTSKYISENRALFEALQKELMAKYGYASVLASDGREQSFRVSRSGINASDDNRFGRTGFCARVYDGKAYAEYAGNSLSETLIPEIVAKIGTDLTRMAKEFDRVPTPLADEESIAFEKSTQYEIHPEELGTQAILDKLSAMRGRVLKLDERLMDVNVNLSYQYYSKLFVSNRKNLLQNVMWTCGAMALMARRDAEVKMEYKGFSNMGGCELLDTMEASAPDMVKTVTDLLSSEDMIPGEYECVCSPEVTGMIVHEAFGHGVEEDMFVKDRALAKQFIGKQVASPIVNMRDGAASWNDVASFFFDDEGNLAQDTLVIDHGILVSGYADAVSAARLGVKATGNGRRESVERKAYTRMTNTFFEPGDSTPEEMIKSIRYGMLLGSPTSGMEDPKNWGIQCMVSYAREIKDGKLTGRIFSPVVLTGYVPDLLKSISMMGPSIEVCGSGACGKGWKEWVKVSDGGPWMKAKIRLG